MGCNGGISKGCNEGSSALLMNQLFSGWMYLETVFYLKNNIVCLVAMQHCCFIEVSGDEISFIGITV